MEHDKVLTVLEALSELDQSEELELITALSSRLNHWNLQIIPRTLESVTAAAKDIGYSVKLGV